MVSGCITLWDQDNIFIVIIWIHLTQNFMYPQWSNIYITYLEPGPPKQVDKKMGPGPKTMQANEFQLAQLTRKTV